MRFVTVGDRSKPVIVMLSGSFCPAKSMAYIYNELKNDYYVIAAEYNGHYEGTTFTTRQNEARELADYLLESRITDIRLLYGQSMGAEVGIELMSRLLKRGVKVRNAFFDGAPCMRLPRACRWGMYHIFKKLIAMVREKGADDMVKMESVKRFANGDAESLRPMLESMETAAKYLTDESVKNETECCCAFDFPPLPDEAQRRVHFFYSKDESACKLCFKHVKMAYPLANYKLVSGYGHLTYSVKNKPKYISMLRAICG